MVSHPLPKDTPTDLKEILWNKHKIEIPIFEWKGLNLIRISIQIYNTKKDVDMVSKLELEEGSPTIVNLPLQNQNNGSGTQNGAAVSSKTEGQPIPNIPSSDFANNTVVIISYYTATIAISC